MGREIEEVLTLLENNLPEGLRILADNGGTLTRESSVTFERAEAGYTRVTIENHFRGAHVPTLVEQELWDYTQAFLRVFKTFVETHET